MMSLPSLGLRATLAAVLLAAAPALVLAQGTDEQREACAPDAVRLCQDTIPDIPKTTVCMKAHIKQLSPHCRAVFNAFTASQPTTAEAAPATAAPDASFAGLPAVPVPDTAIPGMADYRAHIAELCKEGQIDPYTCRNTLQALSAQ